MLRVRDLEASLRFCCEVLGMKLLRQHESPQGKFTLAFVRFGDEKDSTVLELTHNWEADGYDHGDAYGHVAIGVDDVYEACKRIGELGGTIVRDAGPMKGGTTVLAFVEDPDGYLVELLADAR